jgi:predicted ATPase
MTYVLIERASFLASLEGLLGEAGGGSGRLVFLGGEAGVGKTTLATALAGASDGTRVRCGGCDSVTTAEPLGPILDALPELAQTVDQDAGVSRLRLFRKVRDVLSESPMLLVLEDVHWADEATLDILRYLGRRLADAELMILATFRSEELSRDHPLTVVLGDLASLPGVIRMQLPPLTAAGVRQLLEAAGPTKRRSTPLGLTRTSAASTCKADCSARLTGTFRPALATAPIVTSIPGACI